MDRGAYGKGDGLRQQSARGDYPRQQASALGEWYRNIPVIILEEPLVLDMVEINGVWVPQE